MARRLAVYSWMAAVVLGAAMVALPTPFAFAQPGEMDAKGEAEAKEALTLYKQGLYEDAAKIFAKLSVDYPEMLIFERNLGACFYYLRKPGPAISNLRHYLSHKQAIAPDDKEVVERWIAEMEKLREQESAATVPPPATPGQPAPNQTFVPLGSEARLDPLLPTAGTSFPTGPQPTGPAQQTFQPMRPQGQQPAPTLIASPSSSTPTAPMPVALDLSNQTRPAEVRDQGVPFYETWWFWTGAVIVVGGAVTATVLLTHRGTENACSGGSIPCDAIK